MHKMWSRNKKTHGCEHTHEQEYCIECYTELHYYMTESKSTQSNCSNHVTKFWHEHNWNDTAKLILVYYWIKNSMTTLMNYFEKLRFLDGL